jgi:predicted DNA-binding mobile mystery protein A
MRTGWVRAIREALQMSAADLGSRMGVSRQAITAMEASERAGTVRMSTLAAAAEAMDCELVWALVPRTTLQGTVEAQAARIVDAWASQTAQSNLLEGVVVEFSEASRQDHVDDVIRSGRLLWRTDVEG